MGAAVVPAVDAAVAGVCAVVDAGEAALVLAPVLVALAASRDGARRRVLIVGMAPAGTTDRR